MKKVIKKIIHSRIVRPIVVRPLIVFSQRGVNDVEFEEKVNLFALIAICSMCAFMFTLFILLHQMGVY